ncbi:hypothetical protein CDIK_0226 [Cucumispora dikerogammari]|nr:hypothetical protein CDIK_0226 [Cucumispora dikerogammari]
MFSIINNPQIERWEIPANPMTNKQRGKIIECEGLNKHSTENIIFKDVFYDFYFCDDGESKLGVTFYLFPNTTGFIDIKFSMCLFRNNNKTFESWDLWTEEEVKFDEDSNPYKLVNNATPSVHEIIEMFYGVTAYVRLPKNSSYSMGRNTSMSREKFRLALGIENSYKSKTTNFTFRAVLLVLHPEHEKELTITVETEPFSFSKDVGNGSLVLNKNIILE